MHKWLERYKTTWTKTEDLNNIELNALPVYDDRYIKAKTRAFGSKVYTNFCGLNVPEDGAECEIFTTVSTDFLLVSENKYYLQVYLDNCAYKIENTEVVHYLDYNLFESDKWAL